MTDTIQRFLFAHAPVRGEMNQLLGRIFVFRDVTRETAVDRMKTLLAIHGA